MTSSSDPETTLEHARTIFRMGKKLQNHVFSAFSRLDLEMQGSVTTDLSVTQLKLLMSVRYLGEATLGELAAHLGVSSPSVSVMVERLVERGLLVRERSAQDRRKVVIHISSIENDRLEEIERRMLSVFVELLEEIGPEKSAMWIEVLSSIESVLEKRTGGASDRLEQGKTGHPDEREQRRRA